MDKAIEILEAQISRLQELNELAHTNSKEDISIRYASSIKTAFYKEAINLLKENK